MKCSAKEEKGHEMYSKRGKMLVNVQKKRENAMKCSAKEKNAMKCSAKEEKCYEMLSKRGKML